MSNKGTTAVSVNLDNEFEQWKPKLHKIGNTVAYEFLNDYNIVSTLKG
jgi:hypothetical protein